MVHKVDIKLSNEKKNTPLSSSQDAKQHYHLSAHPSCKPSAAIGTDIHGYSATFVDSHTDMAGFLASWRLLFQHIQS